jgi:hypothetical protein
MYVVKKVFYFFVEFQIKKLLESFFNFPKAAYWLVLRFPKVFCFWKVCLSEPNLLHFFVLIDLLQKFHRFDDGLPLFATKQKLKPFFASIFILDVKKQPNRQTSK